MKAFMKILNWSKTKISAWPPGRKFMNRGTIGSHFMKIFEKTVMQTQKKENKASSGGVSF